MKLMVKIKGIKQSDLVTIFQVVFAWELRHRPNGKTCSFAW